MQHRLQISSQTSIQERVAVGIYMQDTFTIELIDQKLNMEMESLVKQSEANRSPTIKSCTQSIQKIETANLIRSL